MIAILAALLLAQSSAAQAEPRDEIISSIQEPRAADPWTQTVEARCGRRRLTISGYGPRRPLGRMPEVRIDGRAVEGEAAGRLIEDLSSGSAVYRFQIRCGPVGDDQSLVVSRGERRPDGDVVYQTSSARFENGRLRSYSGFETTDADGFWVR